MNREEVFETLKIDEGVKYEIYADHLGYHTFGVGHLVINEDPEWGQPFGTPISEERVWECFDKDLDTSISECHALYGEGTFEDFPEEVQQVVVNMMFNLAFAPFWGYVGLALATACSALVNAALLYFALNKAGVFKLTGKDIIFQCRLILAALVMTLVLITVLPSAQQWYEMSIVTRILSLSGLIGLGGVSYLLTII